MIKFIYGDKFAYIKKDTPKTNTFARLFNAIEETAGGFVPLLIDSGITTKDAFVNLWETGDTSTNTEDIKPISDIIAEIKQTECEADKVNKFLVFTAICLKYVCGQNFPFSRYALEYIEGGGDVVTFEDADANKWLSIYKLKNQVWNLANLARGVTSEELGEILSKAESKEDAKEDTQAPPAPQTAKPQHLKRKRGKAEDTQSREDGKAQPPKAEGVPCVEAEEIEAKNPVSYDFYKMLEETKATEKTKRIAEFIAVKFSERLRAFTKENKPTAEDKKGLIKGGLWDIPKHLVTPVIISPRDLAKELFPTEYKKDGQKKTIQRAIKAFTPLSNATITREVTDEQTGQIVKRLTPIFTIEYDFTDGTPEEIIKQFRENPEKFAEDVDAVEALQNIRIFASAPMITNQFTKVTDGETWRKFCFAEKNEDKTRGARRLGVCNVPKIEACKILPVEEMAKETQKSERKQNDLYGNMAELSNVLYNTGYHHDQKTNYFVKDTTPNPRKVAKDPSPATGKTTRTKTATRPARQTKGRGRPRKEK